MVDTGSLMHGLRYRLVQVGYRFTAVYLTVIV
jgi:hypothetical protein